MKIQLDYKTTPWLWQDHNHNLTQQNQSNHNQPLVATIDGCLYYLAGDSMTRRLLVSGLEPWMIIAVAVPQFYHDYTYDVRW